MGKKAEQLVDAEAMLAMLYELMSGGDASDENIRKMLEQSLNVPVVPQGNDCYVIQWDREGQRHEVNDI